MPPRYPSSYTYYDVPFLDLHISDLMPVFLLFFLLPSFLVYPLPPFHTPILDLKSHILCHDS